MANISGAIKNIPLAVDLTIASYDRGRSLNHLMSVTLLMMRQLDQSYDKSFSCQYA